jgi:hypothetical protein
MPPIRKTIVDYVNDELAAYAAEQQSAGQALTAAQGTLVTARSALAEATGQMLELSAEGEDLRRQLAATTSHAEGETLLDQLQANTLALRAKQTEVLDAGEAVTNADAQAAAAQEEAGAAAAAVKRLETGQPGAEERRAEEEAWIAAAETADLAALPTDAGDAGNNDGQAARARLRGHDIPAELFDRAEARWQLAVRRRDAASAAAGAAGAEIATKQGPVTEARHDYEQARDALREFATGAQEQFDTAVILLAGVIAAPALSADVLDRIDGTSDQALFDGAVAAAEKEEARDEKLDDVDTAVALAGAARLTAVAEDPDRDIEQVQDVVDATDAETAARSALAAPQGEYAAVYPALDAWEAAVPDSTWRLFADYERATAMLEALAAVDPPTLIEELADAEDAYVTALEDEDREVRTGLALARLARVREGQAKAVRDSEQGRLVGALRGDRWEAA